MAWDFNNVVCHIYTAYHANWNKMVVNFACYLCIFFVFYFCCWAYPYYLADDTIGCKDSIIGYLMDTELFNFLTKISFATYLIHNTLAKSWYL